MGKLNSISFNINASNPPPNRDYFYDFVRRYAPTCLLIMDNWDVAIEFANQLPQTKVTHRSYSDIEHELWVRETPRDFVEREIAWGNPKVYRHALNEPAIGDLRLPNWLTEVGTRMRDSGYGIVLGNFAVGSYEKYHVESGYFDDLLRLVCQPDNRIYLGIHEYCSILLMYGVGKWSREQLYDKSLCQPDFWPVRSELPIQRMNGELPPYWHFLRSSWLTIRAREMGFGTPKFWVTESGWDSLPDMGGAGILDHFKDRYGIPSPYSSLRGLNTLRPIWNDYFPQWTFEQAAFEQLKWLASIYPDNYVGHCLFTVTNAHDWKIDAGTDYSELYALHEMLLEAKDDPMPTDPPLPPVEPTAPPDDSPLWLRATLTPKRGGVNIRLKPSTTSTIVNTLDRPYNGWIARDAAVTMTDGVWYPISLNEGDDKTWVPVAVLPLDGWARGDVFTFELITEPPPVDPPPDQEFFVKVTPEQRAALIALLEQID